MGTEPRKNTLNCDEICTIIQACEKSKVRVLKYAGLYLNLGPQANVYAGPESASELFAPPGQPVTEITAEQHQTMNKETLLDEEIRTKEARLQQMFIEDPALAEQLLQDGDLEDDDNDTDSDDDESND